MTILDRHIGLRFLGNFVLLFGLLFVFAVTIDVILQLDNFTSAVQKTGATGVRSWVVFGRAVLDFHGPHVFQFYAYTLGLVSVGAAGFTLSQMYRSRELVAIMAVGSSLLRVGLVIIACATGLNVLQLLNQELVLPRLAPFLVRDHDDILASSVDRFVAPLTRDGRGQLLRAASVEPTTGEMNGLLVIERDKDGAAIGRIEAVKATWNAATSAYDLVNGVHYQRRTRDEIGTGGIEDVQPIASVTTDLSPEALKVRRFAHYAQMLSLQQLREMREQGGVDPRLLSRLTYLRLGSIAVNLLVLLVAMPFFLMREPANLLRQSILCAIFTVPVTLGSSVAMAMDLPGLAPAVSVFLPAALMLPIALGRMGAVKT